MPILYVCRPERSIVVTLWWGAVDVPQWEEHLTRMLNDKDFPRTRSHLVDLRSAEIAVGIGPAEFQRIIDFLAPYYKSIAGRRVAILAGRELPRCWDPILRNTDPRDHGRLVPLHKRGVRLARGKSGRYLEGPAVPS